MISILSYSYASNNIAVTSVDFNQTDPHPLHAAKQNYKTNIKNYDFIQIIKTIIANANKNIQIMQLYIKKIIKTKYNNL